MPDNKFFSVQPVLARESRNIFFTVTALILFGVLSVYFSPSEFLFNLLGIQTINGCPLLTFTGIPCPFCGMGRVFSCMLDLYIARSFYYNPMGLIFYVITGIVLISILILSIFKKKVVLEKSAGKLIWVPVVFFILMWILNILFGHHT
jgi:hypothetical protein